MSDQPTGPNQVRVSVGPNGAEAWTSSDRILVSQSPDPWNGVREHADIVRELAERGPFIHEGLICWTCLKARPEHEPVMWFIHPANHEPRCLWRRARALYP